MDTNKPQTSDEEGAQPPPLVARSPYRPLSLRRRQALPAEPQPAVDRPTTRAVFTASPNTVAAALAHTGEPGEAIELAWGPSAAPPAGPAAAEDQPDDGLGVASQ